MSHYRGSIYSYIKVFLGALVDLPTVSKSTWFTEGISFVERWRRVWGVASSTKSEFGLLQRALCPTVLLDVSQYGKAPIQSSSGIYIVWTLHWHNLVA